MATYIVGDIQGCYTGLRKLLDKVSFDPAEDNLIAVGDLIARGPQSLKTLIFLHSLGEQFSTVLGNHDLHFLAIYSGLKQAKKSDLLEPLLSSDRVDELANWLRKKPLAMRLNKHTLVCHAGLYPMWSFKQAVAFSDEISELLQSLEWQAMLANMYGSEPRIWQDSLTGLNRARFIINAFTRMRYLTANLALEFDTKSSPRYADKNLKPWFTLPNPNLKKKHRVIFGHWATLMGQTHSSRFIGLDTGYVWGNSLTFLHLEKDKKITLDQ